MDKAPESYVLELCNGPRGCPNAVLPESRIYDDITDLFQRLSFEELIRSDRNIPLKRHHRFILSVSYCPNACSRPQIADIGLIGAVHPEMTVRPCTGCEACVDACREGAVILAEGAGPVIDRRKCLDCGKCITACPTGTLAMGKKGFRVLLGGRLGRHPRLAHELEGIFSPPEALRIIENSVMLFIDNYTRVKRFADLFDLTGCDSIVKKVLP